MATTKTATDDLQGQVLDTIRKGQEAVVDGLRSWTEAAEQFVPKTAAWPGADHTLPPSSSTPPTTSRSSCPAQRDFFHKAIAVTTPLYEKIEEQGAKGHRERQELTDSPTGSPGETRPHRASSCFYQPDAARGCSS